MTTTHRVLMKIKKALFTVISNDINHPWHKLAVHEYVNNNDVYYIRA